MKTDVQRPIEIRQPEPPEPQVVLAEEIRRLSEGVQRLTANGLNRKAIVVLLADASQVSRGNIKAVLEAMEQLHQTYCVRSVASEG